MPAKDSRQALFGMFHHDGAAFLKIVRLGAQVVFWKMRNTFRGGHNGVQDAAASRITRTGSETETLARLGRQSAVRRSQPDENHELVVRPEPATLSSRNHNNHLASGIADSGDNHQSVASGQQGSNEAHSTRFMRTKMGMAVLILGVSSLIVVPGIVLGIVTMEIPVGIALSGAIATMASLFAGYYYHNN